MDDELKENAPEEEPQEDDVKMRGKRAMVSTVVGSKGQIVIPKAIREMFSIEPGDRVIVLADKKRGIAIVKEGVLYDLAEKAMNHS